MGIFNVYDSSGNLKSGSPPHAWGFCIEHDLQRRRSRFTPTRMGILFIGKAGSGKTTVHPHTHGDFTYLGIEISCEYGSPPHAWGFCRASATSWSPGRFTPTRMGILRRDKITLCGGTVHPHTHGDFGIFWYVAVQATGSPPHAWGF